jgi:hypothetical protein
VAGLLIEDYALSVVRKPLTNAGSNFYMTGKDTDSTLIRGIKWQ